MVFACTLSSKSSFLTTLAFFFFCPFFLTAEESSDVLKVIRERHSGYYFDPSKPVTHEEIYSLIEAACLAPSAFNEQPWNYIFCDKKKEPDSYAKAFKCVGKKNEKWAINAPLLVVIVANLNYRTREEKDPWGEYDTGASVAQMALQAVALGLMTHQMGEECDHE